MVTKLENVDKVLSLQFTFMKSGGKRTHAILRRQQSVFYSLTIANNPVSRTGVTGKLYPMKLLPPKKFSLALCTYKPVHIKRKQLMGSDFYAALKSCLRYKFDQA